MLIYTTKEKESTEMVRTNITSYVGAQEMNFITGIDADINSDTDWQKFLAKLDEMGLDEYQNFVQTAYDRQK